MRSQSTKLGLALLAVFLVSLFGDAALGQEQPGQVPPQRLQGKVSSVIPKTRRAIVRGRQPDFRRLIKDDEQHDRIMESRGSLHTPEERRKLHDRRLARYGESRANSRAVLSDLGAESDGQEKKVVAKSASEPEEESGTTVMLIVLGIFGGAAFLLMRSRN